MTQEPYFGMVTIADLNRSIKRQQEKELRELGKILKLSFGRTWILWSAAVTIAMNYRKINQIDAAIAYTKHKRKWFPSGAQRQMFADVLMILEYELDEKWCNLIGGA